MSPDGKLYLRFNKPIIKPPIKKQSRSLEAQRYYDIKEVLGVSVKSDNALAETQTDFYSISDYELLDLTDRSLLIQLYFNMPEKISEFMLDPDQLVIKIKLGQIFIDVIDFQRLEETLEFSLPLPQQMTEAEFEAIQAVGETAAESAQAFSLLTFIICLVLG